MSKASFKSLVVLCAAVELVADPPEDMMTGRCESEQSVRRGNVPCQAFVIRSVWDVFCRVFLSSMIIQLSPSLLVQQLSWSPTKLWHWAAYVVAGVQHSCGKSSHEGFFLFTVAGGLLKHIRAQSTGPDSLAVWCGINCYWWRKHQERAAAAETVANSRTLATLFRSFVNPYATNDNIVRC